MSLGDFSIISFPYTVSLRVVHEHTWALTCKTFWNLVKAFIWKWNLCKCVLMIWHLKEVILSAIFNFITIKLFQRDAGSLWPKALNQFKNSYVEFVIVHSQEDISQWEPIKQPLGDQEVFTLVTQCWSFPIFFLHRVNWQSKLEQVEIYHKYLNQLVKPNPHSLYFASNYCHMHVVKL